MENRLAIEGGIPVFEKGPPLWPVENEQVQQALQEAYASGNWGRYHGPQHEELCEKLRAYFRVEHSFPCCSGTFAVELALRALKVGEGDEVILAGYDFSGNFRSIEATGARPVLIDIDARSWSLDSTLLPGAISDSTKAVIVSHLHGGIVNMPTLMETAQQNGIAVVEDACQCPGADVFGKRAGTWGDVGVLSFGGSKLLTAGRGGAIITNDERVYQRAKIFCEQGNNAFALSELQAAVLCPQLNSLDEKNARRLASVQLLLKETANLAGWQQSLKLELDRSTPTFFKVPWLLGAKGMGNANENRNGNKESADLFTEDRIDYFIKAIKAEGISLDRGFRGFSKRSARRCRIASDLQHSIDASERTLLLHHPVLLEEPATIERVARGIRKVSAAVFSHQHE